MAFHDHNLLLVYHLVEKRDDAAIRLFRISLLEDPYFHREGIADEDGLKNFHLYPQKGQSGPMENSGQDRQSFCKGLRQCTRDDPFFKMGFIFHVRFVEK